MEEYQQRLVSERAELDDRFTRLGEFLNEETIVGMDKDDVDLLRTQHAIMGAYLAVLDSRINRLY